VIERVWPSHTFIPKDQEYKYIHKTFWIDAVAEVRKIHPDFLFMAEVYWDKEWDLQQQGFDYTYDKKLYDRLLQRNAESIQVHLCGDMDFQSHSVRFLENHDEPRAAHDFSDFEQHQAAAIIAFLIPGMRFFYEGQFEGRTFKIPMQLGRRPAEAVNPDIFKFYTKLINLLSTHREVKAGEWTLLNCKQAWDTNHTHHNFLAYLWILNSSPSPSMLLVAVNYADHQGQTYVELTRLSNHLLGKKIILNDLMHQNIQYERSGTELVEHGLFLDVGRFAYHVFEMKIKSE